MPMLQIAEWLESIQIAIWVRESLWGFPIVVATHIVALTMSVGMLVWFDLRLLGASMPDCPVSTLYRRLAPWMLFGFAVMFVSGGILFAAYATKAYVNVYFRIKVAALLLAGVNAVLFHRLTERGIAGWDSGVKPSGPARAAGFISIGLWTVVILAGRMMSYTMF
jgi:hypothetical protein